MKKLRTLLLSFIFIIIGAGMINAQDTIAPVVEAAYATSLSEVYVVFNEAVDITSAETPANYTGLGTVTAILNSGMDTVTLTLTTPLTEGVSKTFTINNVEDTSGNVMVSSPNIIIVISPLVKEIPNGDFEITANWTATTINMGFYRESLAATVNGDPVTLYPAIGNKFMDVRHTTDGTVLYNGTLRNTFATSYRPDSFSFHVGYVSSFPQERFGFWIIMSRWIGTSRDTVAYLTGTVNISGQIAPWQEVNFGLETSYRNLLEPDTIRIIFMVDRNLTFHPQTALFLDNVSFSHQESSGVTWNGTGEISIPDFIGIKNYPNPFSERTTINYELQINSYVNLSVYDLTGKKIVTLVDQNQSIGEHQIDFDASGLNPGIYIYRLQSSNYVKTGKMVVK